MKKTQFSQWQFALYFRSATEYFPLVPPLFYLSVNGLLLRESPDLKRGDKEGAEERGMKDRGSDKETEFLGQI